MKYVTSRKKLNLNPSGDPWSPWLHVDVALVLSSITLLAQNEIDALRYSPHPNHSHLEKTLKWIKKLNPKQAYLTNMHNDLDYLIVQSETPDNVRPCYDGLIINY